MPQRARREHAFDAILGAFVRGKVHPYRGDEAAAKAALRGAGFKQARLHRGDEHPATRAYATIRYRTASARQPPYTAAGGHLWLVVRP